MIVWQDANDTIRVTLFADSTAEIVVHSTGELWTMAPVALQADTDPDEGHCWLRQERNSCEEYPGRFAGERQGEAVRFTLTGWEGRFIGRFTVQPRLTDDGFEIHISDIDDSIRSLVYPPALQSDSLVLPIGIGRWMRQPVPFPMRYWHLYPSHLRQRWFGGLRGDNGWIAILHQGCEDGGAHIAEMDASPAWLRTRNGWTERIVRYVFTQGGGYVGLARAFRAYAIANGLHRALESKFADNPAGRALIGADVLSFFQGESHTPDRYADLLQRPPADMPAPDANPQVYVSHADARRLITAATARGVDKRLTVMRGWIKGGYDESHPDIFPLEPSLGSPDELAALLADGGDGHVLTALHDNYQDIYPQSESFPNGVIRNKRGDLMRGGIWAGGQSYLINARDGVLNARRNWPGLRALGPRAMFIDTTIAVQFYEDYTPGAPQTRAEDLAYKRDLLNFYRQQGQVVGSEEGSDFGVPYVEWIENRHARVPGVSIPLWPLVFHDAAVCTRYSRRPDRWLEDLLWGYILLWDFRHPRVWDANLDALTAARPVADWHARIGTADMTSHRILTEDGQVEETTFITPDGDGLAIRINFADEPRQVEGVTLAARSFQIKD